MERLKRFNPIKHSLFQKIYLNDSQFNSLINVEVDKSIEKYPVQTSLKCIKILFGRTSVNKHDN